MKPSEEFEQDINNQHLKHLEDLLEKLEYEKKKLLLERAICLTKNELNKMVMQLEEQNNQKITELL